MLDVYEADEMALPADDARPKERHSEGVYIHGLFLEGCAWSSNENKLVDLEPNQRFAQFPLTHLTAMLSREVKVSKDDYICPVYRNKERGTAPANRHISYGILVMAYWLWHLQIGSHS